MSSILTADLNQGLTSDIYCSSSGPGSRDLVKVFFFLVTCSNYYYIYLPSFLGSIKPPSDWGIFNIRVGYKSAVQVLLLLLESWTKAWWYNFKVGGDKKLIFLQQICNMYLWKYYIW